MQDGRMILNWILEKWYVSTWAYSGGGRLGSCKLGNTLEARHPRCVGSITKNFVYYMYSQTQLYFNY